MSRVRRGRTARTFGLISLAVLLAGVIGTSTDAQSDVQLRTYQDVIRVVAQGEDVDELRFQVYGLSGREVFDSGLQTGRTLDWRMTNSRGRKLANGVYLYKIDVRDEHGNLQGREMGKVVIAPDQTQLGQAPELLSTPNSPRYSIDVPQRDQVVQAQQVHTGAQALSGSSNNVNGDDSVIAGGRLNLVTDERGTIAGGGLNQAGDNTGTLVSATDATVGGGLQNTASAGNSTVSGGEENAASGGSATVGGGFDNTASGLQSTVGGGIENTANGRNATVGGGIDNTASGRNATAGGGNHNSASGDSSTVPGGWRNHANGSQSFAAGAGATADHEGAFVWSDSTDPATDTFSSTGSNQFLIEAANGVGINTNDPSQALDVSGDARIRNLTSCDTIDTDDNGNLSCASAGTGLSKFGSTLSIASGGVGATEIDSSAVQERVTGSCTSDFEAIRSIRADGTVECITIVPLIPGATGFDGAALGSGVPSDTIAELRDELQRKTEQIEALKSENKRLKHQMEDLIERVERLEQQASGGSDE